jgi:glyoxylase-like metal-dependent hydrolase (beta-lactamase superfamily II)
VKSTPITDNLIQVTRMRFVNAFLVQEDDGFTLVDTTVSGGADDLISAAQAAGGTIVRIALTHGHGDHVGSLDALRDQLGDSVPVLMSELDARIHAGEQVVDGKLRGWWPKIQTRPDVRLQAGDRVGSLEVVASPGHTPGHVSFLDTRDRSLIVGDVFTTYGGVKVSDRMSFPFPFAAMATWDKAKDRESAQALRALEPTVMVVGHGRAVRAPSAAIDKALGR